MSEDMNTMPVRDLIKAFRKQVKKNMDPLTSLIINLLVRRLEQEADRADRVHSDGRTIAIIWGIEDVMHQSEQQNIPVTEDEAKEILAKMDQKHDANYGISWDIIDFYLQDYKK